MFPSNLCTLLCFFLARPLCVRQATERLGSIQQTDSCLIPSRHVPSVHFVSDLSVRGQAHEPTVVLPQVLSAPGSQLWRHGSTRAHVLPAGLLSAGRPGHPAAGNREWGPRRPVM